VHEVGDQAARVRLPRIFAGSAGKTGHTVEALVLQEKELRTVSQTAAGADARIEQS
jgi:hypothetical protein